MAKKKSNKPKSAPVPPSRRLSIQATQAWLEWVEAAAYHARTDVSKFIDAAATKHAKDCGFDRPPPRRVP
jgi:uncharacterized protein (DUF1778 family)